MDDSDGARVLNHAPGHTDNCRSPTCEFVSVSLPRNTDPHVFPLATD